ncbi:MAG: winged helix-turn-helix domain-containing protein, partial [Terriglobales bacterium]
MRFPTEQKVQFGDFTLDERGYRLQRGDRQLRLEKLPMELLILLLRRRRELVSREEIASHLWGKDVFLDVDHSINTAVRKIRRVLHDDPEKPRFIETVVGKGYRFAAPVTDVADESNSTIVGEAGAQMSDAAEQVATHSTVATNRKIPRVAVLLAGLTVVTLAVLGFVTSRPPRTEAAFVSGIHSLAILPLKNVSGDPQQEYFADGMTDALIDRVSHLPGLRVISRTSAMRLRNSSLSVPEIARALNVDGIVEGSVARQGSRVRITLQLLRGSTGAQVWAEDYDREYRTVPGLHSEVARTIAERIQVGLSPQQQVALAATKTVDPEAEENYLKGEY